MYSAVVKRFPKLPCRKTLLNIKNLQRHSFNTSSAFHFCSRRRLHNHLYCPSSSSILLKNRHNNNSNNNHSNNALKRHLTTSVSKHISRNSYRYTTTTTTKSNLFTVQRHRFSNTLPPHEVIGLPALSPSVEESKIVEWHKKEGDFVGADEAIAKVQTDKAELDWQVVDDVYLAKILLEPGLQVPVGTPCCIFVEEQSECAAFANFDPSKSGGGGAEASSSAPPPSSPSTPTPAPMQAAAAASSSVLSSLPSHEVLGMPALSPTATDGAIVEWLVAEGDSVEEGSGIAEIQTDKSVVTWTSTDELYIARLLHPMSAENKLLVGTPLAVFVESKGDVAAFKDIDINAFLNPASAPPMTAAVSAAPETPGTSHDRQPSIEFRYGVRVPTATPTPTKKAGGDGARQFVSPYARKLASEMSVDLTAIQSGSGDKGRIVAMDVMSAATKQSQQQKQPQPPTAATGAAPQQQLPMPMITGDRSFEDVVATNMREIIGQRLWESKTQSPHFYVTMECEIDNLMQIRADMNAHNTSSKISVNDFIIKACAAALQEIPEVNQSWIDPHKNETKDNKRALIRSYKYIDISVAVATPTGLITPIVKDVNLKSLSNISLEMKDLATRAKDGKLLPNEFQGGTFTISNMGMFGVNHFTAIINPPQSAILAIGGAIPCIKPDLSGHNGGIRQCTVMTVTLSSDHRSVDGAVAARWVNAFKKYVQQPALMLY